MRGIRIRWPILAGALAGMVLIAGLLAWHFLSGPPSVERPFEGERTNLLLTGYAQTAEEGRARELAVVSFDGQGDVLFLILPDDLSVKLRDGTFGELGDIHRFGGPDEALDAVSTLLGVELHAAVAWDGNALATLCEEMEGVSIVVEETVVYDLGEDEGQMEIRPGEQTFDGSEAVAYLRGNSVDSRFVRQQRFLYAVLERGFVGQDPRVVRETIRSVYPLLETPLPLSAVYEFGDSLRQIDLESLRSPILPSLEVSLDGARVVQPRVVETERLVATLIRGVELLTPSEVQVAVFNGNGVRLVASRMADYLRAREFEVTRIANAESFAYSTSYIVVLTDEAKAWILRDALPSAVSIVYPDAFEDNYEALSEFVPFGTDLLLIVGAGMEVE